MNTLIVVKSQADAALAEDIATAVERRMIDREADVKQYALTYLIANPVILKGLRNTVVRTSDAYYRSLNPTMQRKLRSIFARIITISA